MRSDPARKSASLSGTARESEYGLLVIWHRSHSPRRQVAASSARNRKMETELELPSLLQISPRGVLLRSIPIFSKRGLTEQRGLSRMNCRFVLKNRYESTACGGQMHIFEQADSPVLVDHCFKRLNHVPTLMAL